jgi:hypothetical protein
MKRSLLLPALLLTFVVFSCRKDRVCSCVIKETGSVATHSQTQGFPPFLPGSDTTVYSPYDDTRTSKARYAKTNKKQMRGNCFESFEENIKTSEINSSPGIFTITTTNTGKRNISCDIE